MTVGNTRKYLPSAAEPSRKGNQESSVWWHEILGPGLHKRLQETMKENGALTTTLRTTTCSERLTERTYWKQVHGSTSDGPTMCHVVTVLPDNFVICMIRFKKHIMTVCDPSHNTGREPKVR